MTTPTPPPSPTAVPSPSSSFNFGQWEDIFSFYRHRRHPVRAAENKNIVGMRTNPVPDDHHPLTSLYRNSNKNHKGTFGMTTANIEPSRIYRYPEPETHRNGKKTAPFWATAEPWPKSIRSSNLPLQMSFKETMLHNAFNVKSLAIGEHQRINIDPSDHLFLPALKTLSWHTDNFAHAPNRPDRDQVIFKKTPEDEIHRRQSIYQILLAAPNLELIKDFRFETDWELVLSAGKIHTVQKICIFDTANLDYLQRFVEAKPKLTILQLIDTGGVLEMDENRRRRFAFIIRLLFESTYATLRILDLSQFCSEVDIQFPHRLTNLQQLTVGSLTHGYGQRASRVLPNIIYLDKTFPNLKVLDCSRLSSDDNANWNLYFPPATFFRETFETVKTLVISVTLTYYFMEKLHHLCPHFVKLIVESHEHDNSLNFMMMKIFRYWQHLEGLTIKIKDFESATLSLDSTLTGLQEETCQRLRAFGPDIEHDHEQTIMAMQSAQPSLANLTHLKTLDIILGHNCLGKLSLQPDQDEVTFEASKPLLSFVSGKFAFSRIPDLKVEVTFDQECPWGQEILRRFHALISPDVTLKQKQDRCCCRASCG